MGPAAEVGGASSIERLNDARTEALALLTVLVRRTIIAVGLTAVVLFVCWQLGADSITGRGREIISLVAFCSLIFTAAESRYLSSRQGIWATANWKSEALLGAVGGAGLSGICVLWIWAGGRNLVLYPGLWLDVPRFAVEALFAAGLLQIVFPAYALGLFRPLIGLPAAILCSAMLFGLFESRLQAGRFVGYSLAMMVPVLLRLLTGSIVAGTAFFGGWVFIRRIARHVGLGFPVREAWHHPFGARPDPLETPIMWLCLIVALAMLTYVLIRRGERQPPSGTVASQAIAKLLPFGLPHVLAPIDLWLARLRQAKFRIAPIYLPKIFVALTTSAINTAVSLPERLVLARLFRNTRIPDPVFIVGTFRSGTTLLHNLLALDPQFVTPRYFHVLNPSGCVLSGWLFAPLLGCMPNRRPMDNMRMHLFSPAEEEFAIANLCGLSPYWGFAFPREFRHYERFAFLDSFSDQELRLWTQQYRAFLQRILLFRRGRPLLKSPFNTARAAHLLQLFPSARFIHVRRDPYDVYRSNMQMAEEGFPMMQVQDPDPGYSYASRFLENYRRIELAWDEARRRMPAGRVSETRYEDLVADPAPHIHRIYGDLGLEISGRFSHRLAEACHDAKSYRTNPKTPLPRETISQINAALAPLFERWGYPRADDTSPPAAMPPSPVTGV